MRRRRWAPPAPVAAVAVALGLALVAAPASGYGSGDQFPTSAACGPGAADACRAPIEWSTSFYGPAGAGETRIMRRTLFTVYAQAGERVLVGSSAVGVGSGDVVLWEPGTVADPEATTLPAPDATCSEQRAVVGAPTELGRITTRAEELAGPRAVVGGGNPTGYVPCDFVVTTTGLHRLAFYGPAGASSASTGAPTNAQVATSTVIQPAASTTVAAWDVTVRPSDTSVAELPGRLFTYVYAGFTGGNPRPTTFTSYLTTTDGYRYRVSTDGFDPNGFVHYGNAVGFYDADGVTPLNHDVVGAGANQQTLTNPIGGVRLAPAEYPMSFEPLDAATLGALGIPTTPVEPLLTSISYAGSAHDRVSWYGTGGTFTLGVGTPGTYEVVIARDAVNLDPGLPTNRALRGVADAAGTLTVAWDGTDNAGDPFPVGTDYLVQATVHGGEYHAPMLDVESSTRGGPSITLENPPGGVCQITGVASDGTNCTTAFYDDRGYRTSNGTTVGTLGAQLCSGVGDVPDAAFADPTTGFDSTSTQRGFGDMSGANSNTECTGPFGDAKGLDLWTFFSSEALSVRLDIMALPPAPDAVDDAATVPAGSSVTVDVRVNDSGTGLTVTSVTAPGHGTVTIVGGNVVYTPAPGYNSGTDTFTYTVTDVLGGTSTATVTVTVTSAAVAAPRTASATAPATVTLDPLAVGVPSAGATWVPGSVRLIDPVSGLPVTTVTVAGQGVWTIDTTDGTVDFVGDPTWTGTATVDYQVTDSAGSTATSTLTVVVTAPPPPPGGSSGDHDPDPADVDPVAPDSADPADPDQATGAGSATDRLAETGGTLDAGALGLVLLLAGAFLLAVRRRLAVAQRPALRDEGGAATRWSPSRGLPTRGLPTRGLPLRGLPVLPTHPRRTRRPPTRWRATTDGSTMVPSHEEAAHVDRADPGLAGAALSAGPRLRHLRAPHRRVVGPAVHV